MIYIFIINYRTENIIIEAIRSIKEDYIACKIVVLDNSPENNLCKNEIFKKNDIDVIESSVNLGFSRGCNYLNEYVTSKYGSFEYFLLMNPDAKFIKKNSIKILLDELKIDKRNAVISPKIYDLSGNIWFAGGTINYKSFIINNIAKQNGLKWHTYEAEIFNGCIALFNKNIFDKLNGFDPDVFMYFDEAFLTYKIKQQGYQVLYTNKTSARHNVSSSVKGISYIKTYYMNRNRFFYFWEYSQDNLLNKIKATIKVSIKNLAPFMKRLDIKNISYFFLGFVHFLLNRKGKL